MPLINPHHCKISCWVEVVLHKAKPVNISLVYHTCCMSVEIKETPCCSCTFHLSLFLMYLEDREHSSGFHKRFKVRVKCRQCFGTLYTVSAALNITQVVCRWPGMLEMTTSKSKNVYTYYIWQLKGEVKNSFATFTSSSDIHSLSAQTHWFVISHEDGLIIFPLLTCTWRNRASRRTIFGPDIVVCLGASLVFSGAQQSDANDDMEEEEEWDKVDVCGWRSCNQFKSNLKSS